MSTAIYELDDVRVERTAVLIGGDTYAARHIVALKVFPVSHTDPRPDRLRPSVIVALSVAIFCLAMTVKGFLTPPVGWGTYGWLASFLLSGLFMREPTEARPTLPNGFELELVMSTGKRVTFMRSQDEGEIERARAALQQVIG